jgi:hypothetical protein
VGDFKKLSAFLTGRIHQAVRRASGQHLEVEFCPKDPLPKPLSRIHSAHPQHRANPEQQPERQCGGLCGEAGLTRLCLALPSGNFLFFFASFSCCEFHESIIIKA